MCDCRTWGTEQAPHVACVPKQGASSSQPLGPQLPRRLASSADTPVPIRISPEYQLPPTVSVDTAALVSEVVSAAILTLQTYIQAGNQILATSTHTLMHTHMKRVLPGTQM